MTTLEMNRCKTYQQPDDTREILDNLKHLVKMQPEQLQHDSELTGAIKTLNYHNIPVTIENLQGKHNKRNYTNKTK